MDNEDDPDGLSTGRIPGDIHLMQWLNQAQAGVKSACRRAGVKV